LPIYDYRCDHCGHVFSAVQSFKDESLEKCPSCGKRPRRLFTVPAIVFKGSGWYKTDSRAPVKSDSGSETKEKKSEGKGDKSETKTTEAKTTETKSEKSAPKGEAAS
jgi:putative FmdB family regulatory protein